MYYGMGQLDFSQLVQGARGYVESIPQTQRDIRVLAETAQQAKSPEMQALLTEVRGELQTFVGVQLALQALSTAAIVGLFLIGLRNHMRGK